MAEYKEMYDKGNWNAIPKSVWRKLREDWEREEADRDAERQREYMEQLKRGNR